MGAHAAQAWVVLTSHHVRQARNWSLDRLADFPTLEQRIDDVRAVMDASGPSERHSSAFPKAVR